MSSIYRSDDGSCAAVSAFLVDRNELNVVGALPRGVFVVGCFIDHVRRVDCVMNSFEGDISASVSRYDSECGSISVKSEILEGDIVRVVSEIDGGLVITCESAIENVTCNYAIVCSLGDGHCHSAVAVLCEVRVAIVAPVDLALLNKVEISG